MSGKTAYDALPKMVRFDRELCSLSASSIERILTHIATDELRVHRDIVHHVMQAKDKYHKSDEGWSHALLQVCELASAKPQQLLELVTKQRWRYYFSKICWFQFVSVKSDWYRVHARHDLKYDDPTDDESPSEPFIDATSPDDLLAMVDPTYGPEGELTDFLANLSILFRDCDWADQKLWSIRHFDPYGWLIEEKKTRPKARMTYRLIQHHTGIPHQSIHGSIKRIDAYIAAHYVDRFGPFPKHLIDKF